MPSPIELRSLPPAAPHPARSTAPGRGLGFAERLADARAPAPVPIVPERLRALWSSIASGERALDRVIGQATAGRDFSPTELIAIQARVYRWSQELELVSKLVDKACQGVRQTLQTQV